MLSYSIDLLYAWEQLGLDPGASLAEIDAVLKSRMRPPQAKSIVEFFHARLKLGALTDDFSALRTIYRRKAFMLHPDRNIKNLAAEEELKELNSAFDLVTKMHRQAKEFYKKENTKQKNDKEPKTKNKRSYYHPGKHEAGTDSGPTRPAQRYMAAPILRSMRQARLGHLPRHAVIGNIVIEKKNDLNVIYDIIMLPAGAFMRARAHLSAPTPGLQFQPGSFDAPYIPQNVKEFIVPSDAKDAEKAAREYFKKEFGIDQAL